MGRVCIKVPCEEWDCNCDWHQQQALFKKTKTEIKMRKAALEDINFPDKDVSYVCLDLTFDFLN